MAAKDLVIVESPTKARTLTQMLGKGYLVRASLGHVRDLPKSRREIPRALWPRHRICTGVDVEGGFLPYYVIPEAKRKTLAEIRELAQDAPRIYLASDPDREGEAISWHLVQAAELKEGTYSRVVFHEITPQAIGQAFQSPREIDMQLVEAQEARRILDRLVGYKLSPFLWEKVRRGLSAGRVQSVALRLVVEREAEIEAFVPQEYWSIEAELAKQTDGPSFRAKLAGRLEAAGKDRVKKLEIGSEEAARRLVDLLREAAYRVAAIKKGEKRRRPPAPFITSTLQQEASRRLGFSPKRTMMLAQQLYEGLPLGGGEAVGLITYMRTDSTHLAASAVQEAREHIGQAFGAEYLPKEPRAYKTKVKGAQEAHEAIRPTAVVRTPEAIGGRLSPDQRRLYALIWQRMVACQMADALYDTTAVDIDARPGKKALPGGPAHEPSRPDSAESQGNGYRLRASATALRFPGYRRLYTEAEEEKEDAVPLPELAAGEDLRLVGLHPQQHFTEPPPRYSEASLVKALEEKGIGRPSTYAPIIATIQDRGYVERLDGKLRPQELGRLVNDILLHDFPAIIDVAFTARMEEELDEIARGERPWQTVVQDSYTPLVEALAVASLRPAVREESSERCDLCGGAMIIRWGRYGRFLACAAYPQCKGRRALEEEPTVEEACPECGGPMAYRQGRFGPFLSCTRYPECRGKRPFLQRTGAACPQCGGALVVRQTRRGRRTFYGCANYPTCNFATWERPLEEPCPECGGLLLLARREEAHCHQCAFRGPAPGGPPEV